MNLNPFTKQGKALCCEVCEMIVEKWLGGSSDFVTNSIQSNLSNTDTEGTEQSVRIREVSVV